MLNQDLGNNDYFLSVVLIQADCVIKEKTPECVQPGEKGSCPMGCHI